jgi:hypothetical protein
MFCDRVKQNDLVGIEKQIGYRAIYENMQHYALMQEDIGIEKRERKNCLQREDGMEQLIQEERKKKIELLGELKIKIITYQNHVEWTDWFRLIRENCRRARRGLEYEDPNK